MITLGGCNKLFLSLSTEDTLLCGVMNRRMMYKNRRMMYISYMIIYIICVCVCMCMCVCRCV